MCPSPFPRLRSKPLSHPPPSSSHLLLSACFLHDGILRNSWGALGFASLACRGCWHGRGHHAVGGGRQRCPALGVSDVPRELGPPTHRPSLPAPGGLGKGVLGVTCHRGCFGRTDLCGICPLGFVFLVEGGFRGQNHRHRAMKLGLEQAKNSII